MVIGKHAGRFLSKTVVTENTATSQASARKAISSIWSVIPRARKTIPELVVAVKEHGRKTLYQNTNNDPEKSHNYIKIKRKL